MVSMHTLSPRQSFNYILPVAAITASMSYFVCSYLNIKKPAKLIVTTSLITVGTIFIIATNRSSCKVERFDITPDIRKLINDDYYKYNLNNQHDWDLMAIKPTPC